MDLGEGTAQVKCSLRGVAGPGIRLDDERETVLGYRSWAELSVMRSDSLAEDLDGYG